MFDRAVRDADWVVNKVITSHTQETKCSVYIHSHKLAELNKLECCSIQQKTPQTQTAKESQL